MIFLLEINKNKPRKKENGGIMQGGYGLKCSDGQVNHTIFDSPNIPNLMATNLLSPSDRRPNSTASRYVASGLTILVEPRLRASESDQRSNPRIE